MDHRRRRPEVRPRSARHPLPGAPHLQPALSAASGCPLPLTLPLPRHGYRHQHGRLRALSESSSPCPPPPRHRITPPPSEGGHVTRPTASLTRRPPAAPPDRRGGMAERKRGREIGNIISNGRNDYSIFICCLAFIKSSIILIKILTYGRTTRWRYLPLYIFCSLLKYRWNSRW